MIKAKALDIWYQGYAESLKRHRSAPAATDVFIAVCDHFEPFHDADRKEAFRRLDTWHEGLKGITNSFKDSGGISPRHSFFYPIEQYDEEVLKKITSICSETGGEVEIHLHHDNDTPANTRDALAKGIDDFSKHGHLSVDSSGNKRYGFVHGNWALANSHPEGKGCGVTGELKLLRETGCYADMTLPSAPNRTQVKTVNSIYYAKENNGERPHETGIHANSKSTKELRDAQDHLLLVQGPLGLNWKRRKHFFLPRVENSDLTRLNPPTMDRFRLWSELAPIVQGQPTWRFIKLHTHGALPSNSPALICDQARRFHSDLESLKETKLRYHYVSAREMTNLIHAAEDGFTDSISDARNYLYKLNS